MEQKLEVDEDEENLTLAQSMERSVAEISRRDRITNQIVREQQNLAIINKIKKLFGYYSGHLAKNETFYMSKEAIRVDADMPKDQGEGQKMMASSKKES